MGWSSDEELAILIHDKDVTLDGPVHQYVLHLAKLRDANNPEEFVLHKRFLKVFWDEYPDPYDVLEKVSPAVIYEALYAMLRTNDADKNSIKLIDLLKKKNQIFLSDYKTDNEAAKNYKDFEDNSWALFEHLSVLIKDDKVFSDRLLNIYRILGPTDEQIIERRKLKAEPKVVASEVQSVVVTNATNETEADVHHSDDNDSDSDIDSNNVTAIVTNNNNHSNSNHKKKPKPHKKKHVNHKEQENPLLQEIFKLNPTKDTLIGGTWNRFFLDLCKALKPHMLYQNNHLDSYDLLTHENNMTQFKTLIQEAIKKITSSVNPDQLTLLLIISKFDDACMQSKNTPVVVSMPAVLEIFSVLNPDLWARRASSKNIKDHFFNDTFPQEYLKLLTPQERYNVRMQFEETVARLPAMPARSALIKYFANKLSLDVDPTPVSKPAPQSTSSSDRVLPGSENKPWGKFIENVYKTFEQNNPLWSEEGSDADKLEKLQPILEKFKNDFPTEAERAQAQRHFINFIGSEDCKFASGAEKYAWMFLEEMIPQATTSVISPQRQALRDLKKTVEQGHKDQKEAELFMKTLTFNISK